MLNSLRNQAGSFWAKILLGLLILSFAVWGIEDMIYSATGNNIVVEVGDRTIGRDAFHQQLQTQKRELQIQFGNQVPEDIFKSLGLWRQALNIIIQRTLLDIATEYYGIRVGDADLAEYIKNDSLFHNADGNFDKDRFYSLLRSNNISEKQFTETVAQELKTQLLVNTIIGWTPATSYMAETTHIADIENRVVDIYMLDTRIVATPDAPAEEDLVAFYDQRAAIYALPETRGFSYITFNRDSISQTIDVSESELRQLYDERVALFGEASNLGAFETLKADLAKELNAEKIEERTANLIDQVESGIASGATLPEIAKEAGITLHTVPSITDQGETTQGKAVGEANNIPSLIAHAFSLDPEAEPYLKDLGADTYAVVHITEHNPAIQQPFETVRSNVLQDWIIAEKARLLREKGDALVEALKATSTPRSIAAANNATVKANITVTRKTQESGGLTIPEHLQNLIYSVAENSFTSAIATQDGNVMIAHVKERIAPEVSDEQLKTNYDLIVNMYQNEILEQYLNGMQKRTDVQVNDSVVTQMVDAL